MEQDGNKPPKEPVDWERIELDYRAGIMSLREIAKANPGTNHVAIKRRAEREKWPRDLAERIQARAKDIVTRASVTGDVTRAVTPEQKITEREVVESAAQRVAEVQTAHQASGVRMRLYALALLGELEGQTANLEQLEQLGELLRREDKSGRDALNDLYQKIISTPGRVDSAKKVAETLRTAVGIEREAWGMETKGDKGPGHGLPVVTVKDLTGRK